PRSPRPPTPHGPTAWRGGVHRGRRHSARASDTGTRPGGSHARSGDRPSPAPARRAQRNTGRAAGVRRGLRASRKDTRCPAARPPTILRMNTRDHSSPPPLAPRHWPTWLGIGLMAAAARIPWPVQRALGRGLGGALRLLLGSRRRIAARNLELCFPELDAKARQRLLRRHFASLGIGLFEFARAWWGSVEPLRRGLEVEGLEHMEGARRDGRGVIVVSGHFTTLE